MKQYFSNLSIFITATCRSFPILSHDEFYWVCLLNASSQEMLASRASPTTTLSFHPKLCTRAQAICCASKHKQSKSCRLPPKQFKFTIASTARRPR
jgi:hypothetical protein